MMMNNRTLKKTTSMGFQNPPQAATYYPTKSPLIEFPTSPQLIFGQEILHFSHPQHPLSRIDLPDLFTCSGCKEFGAGMRFTCQQCEFQLHEFCARAPDALKGHPFHSHHQLSFYSKPVKGGSSKSKCDICSKPIKGFAFRCNACSFQMHPSCAMLSTNFNTPGHVHTLGLLPATKTSNGDLGFVCGECQRKRSGREYHCTVCDYHLHAVCAKDMINGLHDNGIKGVEKPSMLGTAARLASQVFVEFIGGIIEGLGEGVGQAFAQDIIKGKGTSGTSGTSGTTRRTD